MSDLVRKVMAEAAETSVLHPALPRFPQRQLGEEFLGIVPHDLQQLCALRAAKQLELARLIAEVDAGRLDKATLDELVRSGTALAHEIKVANLCFKLALAAAIPKVGEKGRKIEICAGWEVVDVMAPERERARTSILLVGASATA